jgi:hypothetical protein
MTDPTDKSRVCGDCGKAGYSISFTPTCPEKRAMDAHGVCFTCAFWRVRLEKTHDTVIAGRIYSVGDVNKKPGDHNGMAGRRFDIEYFDGRRVTTHDLWAGGEVPEKYRDRIPDTARFLGGAGFHRIGDGGAWNASTPQAA